MASTRSNARLIRFGIFALVLIGCGYILTRGSSFQPPNYQQTQSPAAHEKQTGNVAAGGGAGSPAGAQVPLGKNRGPIPKAIMGSW